MLDYVIPQNDNQITNWEFTILVWIKLKTEFHEIMKTPFFFQIFSTSGTS